MLTPKQNFLETIRRGGNPDRIVKQFEGLVIFRNDPFSLRERGNKQRHEGMPAMKDAWGTEIIWPVGTPAAMPRITEDTKVIKDIVAWRDFVKVPDIIDNCSQDELWARFNEGVNDADRENNLTAVFMATGVFERLHFLMGFEDMFVNFVTEPEAMKDLCDAIGEFRFSGMKLIVDHAHPDVLLSHDDWGSKNNLFIQPELWREFIKPQYAKAYKYAHDHGVIIMHHADSFCEQIVEDMVDLHIDVWQGVLPQNDIVKLQKQLNGRMALMGGIDASIIDRADSTEAEVRAETGRVIETYCPHGNFIPCVTYGLPGTIYPHCDKYIDDEIEKYNHE